MADWTFHCWSCHNPTVMIDKVMRHDTCPHCGLDMRSCKNCKYYDPGSHNDCREHISEYIPDKERSNVCGMYTPHEGPHERGEDIDLAKARLDALFGKR